MNDLLAPHNAVDPRTFIAPFDFSLVICRTKDLFTPCILGFQRCVWLSFIFEKACAAHCIIGMHVVCTLCISEMTVYRQCKATTSVVVPAAKHPSTVHHPPSSNRDPRTRDCSSFCWSCTSRPAYRTVSISSSPSGFLGRIIDMWCSLAFGYCTGTVSSDIR